MQTNESINIITDFSEILQTYGLSYRPDGYNWLVGEIRKTQGWILHVSCIESDLLPLFSKIVPELIHNDVPFKIIRDIWTAQRSIEGSLSYADLGKMISIYPDNDQKALEYAKWLIELTGGFRGPAIPTDRYLGGTIYTRYGSFNPILVQNMDGIVEKHIYDSAGKLKADPYNIPFSMPNGISWPFMDITTAMPPKIGKLLNGRYYPLAVIKPDAKGVVMQGLYFKSLLKITSCLLKEGKKNMFFDNFGRDIQDRLKWQYDVYADLAQDIPIPKIFDLFQDDVGSFWLTMEYIKGLTLTRWIEQVCINRCWRHLPPYKQAMLLDKLLEMLEIIQTLHKKGYVHRDIMPDNFIIDKNGKLWLIDLELTWSTSRGLPSPPYRLGTPGHMSPEQIGLQTPTVKEDIFGLGGIMVLLFTTFLPTKFEPSNSEYFKEELQFFIDDLSVSNIICRCQSSESDDRPYINEIQNTIQEKRAQLDENKKRSNKTDKISNYPPINKYITKTVQSGLNGLAERPFISENLCWVSLYNRKEKKVGNAQLEIDLQEGWHNGMAGVAWLVSNAKKAGYPIKACSEPFKKSWDFIQFRVLKNETKNSSGLYQGKAGIALALAAGLESGMLVTGPETDSFLQSLFSNFENSISLSTGVSGQGISLINLRNYLPDEFFNTTIRHYKDKILESQSPDGSWQLSQADSSPRDILLGLDNGVSGIIWFLLHYLKITPDDRVKTSVERGLNWLIKMTQNKKGRTYWPISSKSKDTSFWSTGRGIPGVILTFLKAFEITNNERYREIVTASLNQFAEHVLIHNLTTEEGLSGLGHLYLDAYQQLNESYCLERSQWIQNVLIHTFKHQEVDKGSWTPDTGTIATAGLFTGISGIIYFLLRSQYPGKFNHPLSA